MARETTLSHFVPDAKAAQLCLLPAQVKEAPMLHPHSRTYLALSAHYFSYDEFCAFSAQKNEHVSSDSRRITNDIDPRSYSWY
jgi:hypothetical protein